MSQTVQPPPGPPRAGRGNPALGDVVRSVLVLAVLVLAAVWFGGLFRSETVVEPQALDPRGVARQSADAAPYPLLVPASMPDGWRATQARWDPATQHWHVGLLTADDEYVGIEQMRGASIDELVDLYAPAGDPGGEIDVGAVPWRVYAGVEGGRTAIVTRSLGVSTMVLGSPSAARLASFAGSLESVDRH